MTKTPSSDKALARKEGILPEVRAELTFGGRWKLLKPLWNSATIVTIIPDGGVKYLSKIFDDEWMKKNKLL